MYFAAMTDEPGLSGTISETFAAARYLLILDTDKGTVVTTYPRGGADDCALARRIVQHDCEAVLCGPIEEAPFTIIADEGCVTRYLAAGQRTGAALADALGYRLNMIPDFIGGTGCHSGEGNCEEHHHDHGES